jgi:hypothetical protein
MDDQSRARTAGAEGLGTFLPMTMGLASVAIVLAAIHGASQLISQFLMAFVITVAVAPSVLACPTRASSGLSH